MKQSLDAVVLLLLLLPLTLHHRRFQLLFFTILSYSSSSIVKSTFRILTNCEWYLKKSTFLASNSTVEYWSLNVNFTCCTTLNTTVFDSSGIFFCYFPRYRGVSTLVQIASNETAIIDEKYFFIYP